MAFTAQGGGGTKGKNLFILDNGHGGVIGGKYVTEGKRSPETQDGRQLYEGVFNRRIVQEVSTRLDKEGINNRMLVPEDHDIELHTRTQRANNIETYLNKIFISVHANAYGTDFNSAKGIETYYFPGSNKGRKLAKRFQDNLIDDTKAVNRGIKTADFYVLRNTDHPAILLELGFMTNREELEKLMSPEYKDTLVDSIVRTIREIENV